MSLADRIWARDPTVWTTDPTTPEVADRLGWLDVADTMPPHLKALGDLARGAAAARRVILCGMGGSSLAPEVLARTFGRQSGHPALHLWDTTHPDAVPALTPDDLVLIASKSGTTIETACFEEWAWQYARESGDRFIAVTDPGTPLARRAAARGYRAVFTNPADIGGRFSALSLFGLVPAALLGLDAGRLLDRGRVAAAACRDDDGPWVTLGRALAEQALAGRDKLTLFTSPSLATFGLWLEQLIAESTGKGGRGIVPVVGEPPGLPDAYGDDRVFVTCALRGEQAPTPPPGHPVYACALADRYDLGEQFFGWSFATAVMGHVLGVNPFDQPNVGEAKVRTQQVLAGGQAAEPPDGRADLRALVEEAGPGDYIGLLVYAPPSAEGDATLATFQRRLRDRTRVAVTAGWGPRYLHSSGQLHKGGPATGRFILVTPPASRDVAIPGRSHTFGALCAAQAAGDRAALKARGRPVVCVASLDVVQEVL